MGCPIQKSPDQSSLTAPRGLSQPGTSFIASTRQGIHHLLFVAYLLRITILCILMHHFLVKDKIKLYLFKIFLKKFNLFKNFNLLKKVFKNSRILTYNICFFISKTESIKSRNSRIKLYICKNEKSKL